MRGLHSFNIEFLAYFFRNWNTCTDKRLNIQRWFDHNLIGDDTTGVINNKFSYDKLWYHFKMWILDLTKPHKLSFKKIFTSTYIL